MTSVFSPLFPGQSLAGDASLTVITGENESWNPSTFAFSSFDWTSLDFPSDAVMDEDNGIAYVSYSSIPSKAGTIGIFNASSSITPPVTLNSWRIPEPVTSVRDGSSFYPRSVTALSIDTQNDKLVMAGVGLVSPFAPTTTLVEWIAIASLPSTPGHLPILESAYAWEDVTGGSQSIGPLVVDDVADRVFVARGTGRVREDRFVDCLDMNDLNNTVWSFNASDASRYSDTVPEARSFGIYKGPIDADLPGSGAVNPQALAAVYVVSAPGDSGSVIYRLNAVTGALQEINIPFTDVNDSEVPSSLVIRGLAYDELTGRLWVAGSDWVASLDRFTLTATSTRKYLTPGYIVASIACKTPYLFVGTVPCPLDQCPDSVVSARVDTDLPGGSAAAYYLDPDATIQTGSLITPQSVWWMQGEGGFGSVLGLVPLEDGGLFAVATTRDLTAPSDVSYVVVFSAPGLLEGLGTWLLLGTFVIAGAFVSFTLFCRGVTAQEKSMKTMRKIEKDRAIAEAKAEEAASKRLQVSPVSQALEFHKEESPANVGRDRKASQDKKGRRTGSSPSKSRKGANPQPGTASVEETEVASKPRKDSVKKSGSKSESKTTEKAEKPQSPGSADAADAGGDDDVGAGLKLPSGDDVEKTSRGSKGSKSSKGSKKKRKSSSHRRKRSRSRERGRNRPSLSPVRTNLGEDSE